jgi:excisionase family DNA binding protein
MSRIVDITTRQRSESDGASLERTRVTYTVAEVAHLLGLSRASTYALIRAGDIPARRMGSRWIIPRRRFHAWLDGADQADNPADRTHHRPGEPRR